MKPSHLLGNPVKKESE